MFGLAVEWGWRPDNPVRGVKRYPEEKRTRWLTGIAASGVVVLLISAVLRAMQQ